MEWEREKTYIREDAMEQKAVEDARNFLAEGDSPEKVRADTCPVATAGRGEPARKINYSFPSNNTSGTRPYKLIAANHKAFPREKTGAAVGRPAPSLATPTSFSRP